MRAVALFALCGAALAAGSIGNAPGSTDPLLAKMADIKEHRRARRQRAQKPMVLSQSKKVAQKAVQAFPPAVFQFIMGGATTECGNIQWPTTTCSIFAIDDSSNISPPGLTVLAFNVNVACSIAGVLHTATFPQNVTLDSTGQMLILDDQDIAIITPTKQITVQLRAGSIVFPNFDASAVSRATYSVGTQSISAITGSALNFAELKVCLAAGEIIEETILNTYDTLTYDFVTQNWLVANLTELIRDQISVTLDPPYSGSIDGSQFPYTGKIALSQGSTTSTWLSVDESKCELTAIAYLLLAILVIHLAGEKFIEGTLVVPENNNVASSPPTMIPIYWNSNTAVVANQSSFPIAFTIDSHGLLSPSTALDLFLGTFNLPNVFASNKIASNARFSPSVSSITQIFNFFSDNLTINPLLNVSMPTGSLNTPKNIIYHILSGSAQISTMAANLFGSGSIESASDSIMIIPNSGSQSPMALVGIYNTIGTIDIFDCGMTGPNGAVNNIPFGTLNLGSVGLMTAKSTLSSETFTASLDAGAELDLSGPGLSDFVAVLPAGVLNPNTFCFSMAAGAQLAVKRSSTGHVFPGARLPVDATICPDGRLSNTASGAVIGYISIFGTIKFGGAPPVGIPPQCTDMVTGMMVLVQRGGYANAMQTCTTHGLSPLDVTGTNIAAASALLEACGGLVVSAYVGSFDGQTNGGCLALYTGATSGIGTVATALCDLNKPVICVETP